MGTSSYEKSVKGATKVKNAAPKAKYIEYLLTATHDPSSTADVFRFLSIRLSDTAWTVVFKALLVVHILIREATPGVALSYLADNPRILQISGISEVSFQGRNIWAYAEYLQARARAYGDTGIDFVKSDGQGRLRRMTVAKGLLRETEIVQKQIHALLKCSDFLTDEPENEIMLTAFRLVTLDLLTLFSVMNEGTINVLEHYFTLSRPDSEYALKLYRRFSAQTDAVVKFLRTARRFEHATRLQIPNLKHASTDLEKLLEDDLNDPEFDARRKEYRDQKDAEKSGKVGKLRPTRSGNATPAPLPKDNPPTLPNRPATASQAARPQKDLVDFFDSIDPTTSQANTQSQYGTNNPFVQPTAPAPATAPQQFAFPTGWSQQQTAFAQAQAQAQAQQQGQQMPMQTGIGTAVTSNPTANTTNNPFGAPPTTQPQQLQAQPTGAGFGGFGPQPFMQPQQTGFGAQPQQQQQAPGMQPQGTGFPSGPFGGQATGMPTTTGPSPFTSTPLSSIPQNGVFNPQQQQQPGAAPFQQPMQTGPAGYSFSSAPSSAPQTTPFGAPPMPMQRQRTASTAAVNPFRQSTLTPQRTGQNPFARRVSTQPAGLMPQRTGTNPFAKPQQPQATGLVPQATGTTNPFRQSMMAQANIAEQNTTIGGIAVNSVGGGGIFNNNGMQGQGMQGMQGMQGQQTGWNGMGRLI